MSGTWRWVTLAFVALLLIGSAFQAFAVPWTWTRSQWLVLIYGICICIAVGRWGLIWLQEGTSGVKSRWSAVSQQLRTRRSENFYLLSVGFWIVVAIGLVVAFNILK